MDGYAVGIVISFLVFLTTFFLAAACFVAWNPHLFSREDSRDKG